MDTQISPYKPLTIYDAPGAVFSQLIDGELGFGSLKHTFTDPMQLTPSQRDGMAERLKRASGNSRVVNSMVDVALNPWTWLMFATTPIGEGATANLFKTAGKYSMYVRERAPMLASIGGLTSQQALFDTRAGAAIQQFERGMRTVTNSKEYVAYNEEMAQVLTKNGLTEHGLRWEKYAEGSAEAEKARELANAVHAKMTGMDQARDRVSQVYEDGTLKTVRTAVERQLDGKLLDETLAKYGADALPTKAREVFKSTAKSVFGGDDDSVIRMWRHLSKGMATAGGQEDVAGRAMVRTILGEAFDGLKSADVSEETLRSAVRAYRESVLGDTNYFPANVVDTLYKGESVARDTMQEARWAAAMRSGNNVIPRVDRPLYYHPDDLRYLSEKFKGTQSLRDEISKAEAVLQDSAEDERAIRFQRVRPADAIGKHVDGMGRTYAMFVQDVGDGVREKDAELIGKLKSWNVVDKDAASWAPSLSGKRAGLEKTIGEIEGTEFEPAGGISIADVLYADHGVAQNWWQRDTISKVVVPRLMGRIADDSVVKMTAVLKAKEMMGSFVESGAGSAIEGSSQFGKKFIGKMRSFSQGTDEAFEEGEGLERFLLKTLYAAHLGLNVPSAVVNMTQPFLFAGSQVGYKNVMKGYAASFKEFGDYIGERAAQNFRPISTWERAQLVRKTHKFANWGGEDLLEIAGDTMENIEGKAYNALIAGHEKKGVMDRLLFEYPMKMFGGAEMMNRNVAAHAAYFSDLDKIAKGVGVSESQMGMNIKNLVRETQFGGHWMNTPQAFLPEGANMKFPTKGLLSNPLLHQFLTFPLRSFTAWTYVAPKMGGRENPVGGFINDTIRGMAASTIGYEVAKDLFGVDMSRAGFAASVTDIIPGFSQGRMDFRDSAIPTPPIVDIPYNAIKALVTDDAELWRQTLPRVIPGGVAISRALGVAPDIGALGFIGQKQYADWSKMNSDGSVPVFDESGNLIKQQGAASLILSGLGLDMGANTDESKVMQYLVKQRQRIVDARREYMTLTMNGRNDQAEMMRKSFEEDYKVPLTVTQGQWKDFMTRRSEPRVDRELDRFSNDMRQQFFDVARLNAAAGQQAGQPAPVIQGQPVVGISQDALRAGGPQRQSFPDQRRAGDQTVERWGPFAKSDFEVGSP